MHDQDSEIEPAHHARRPMNAFLIFCKRHRSVVRDRYPNLENRSITKILGEWWANLDKEEKACYTGLAKQYKDAFFSANPDFKWYKLPAPPLRTLSSRPREANDKIESPSTEPQDSELEKTNNNSTRVDLNKKPRDDDNEIESRPLSMFTPGKLADEAQMGGLSSLLETKTETQSTNPYYSPPSFKYNPLLDHRSQIFDKQKGPREDIKELQNALSETTKVFEEEFEGEPAKVYRQVHNEFTNQDVIDQIVEKRYSRDDDYGYQRNGSDDERRSGRSCKGKRYQEFMAVGGLIVNKRQKKEYDRMPDEGYSATCSWDPGSSQSEESSVTDDSKQGMNESNEIEMKVESPEEPEHDHNQKTFKASDFDLDAKIKALPSLSLEKFQQRKRDNKRKKKTVNLKPKPQKPQHIYNSVPRTMFDDRRSMESWRETVRGSQKRKPRKVSITRIEVNSMVPSMSTSGVHTTPEIKIATEAPSTVVHSMDICQQSPHGNVDLLALATLAEVAANTSKLEDSTIENMTAKVSEGETAV